jgi:hypothetical protein
MATSTSLPNVRRTYGSRGRRSRILGVAVRSLCEVLMLARLGQLLRQLMERFDQQVAQRLLTILGSAG